MIKHKFSSHDIGLSACYKAAQSPGAVGIKAFVNVSAKGEVRAEIRGTPEQREAFVAALKAEEKLDQKSSHGNGKPPR